MEMKYEKPKLNFVPLQNPQKIADTCWGNHGSTYRYYDTDGVGYLSYIVTGQSCSIANGALEVRYYDEKGETGLEGELLSPDDPRYIELYNKLDNATPSNGAANFKGEAALFPETPGGMS